MNARVIVCPVELSPNDKAVVARAIALARWHDAELHVAYVRPGRRAGAPSATVAADDPFEKRLADFLNSIDLDAVAVTPVVLQGDPVKAVAQYTRMKSADLVVAGQNGRRGSWYWSAGAFATALGRAVECPAIMIPGGAGDPAEAAPSFQNIVCGIDFSPASIGALELALTVAQQSDGRITLLHALEEFPHETVYPAAHAFRSMDDYRSRIHSVERELWSLVPTDAMNWCEVDAAVVTGGARDAVLAVAAERTADLIVIGHPRRAGFEQIVMGSVVSAVLRHARCPVLTVPGPSEGMKQRSESTNVLDAGNVLQRTMP